MPRYYNNWPGKLYYEFNVELNETFSQAYQDIFVLSLLNGKNYGWYLEIGCNVPDYTNNTYLLTKDFNWNGISIDYQDFGDLWRSERPNNFFFPMNALTADYNSLLSNKKQIDYLQLDIEPSYNTFEVLKILPTNQRYAIITFETDYYLGGDNIRVRTESREYLKNLGYELIVPDVLVDNGNPYEDWYVDLNLVDRHIALDIQERATITSDPKKLLFNI